MATPDEITDAAATTAADGVESASVDGQSAQAMDPMKQLDVADRIRARQAVSGTNANGGPKSPFLNLRIARVVPPGGV